MFTQHAYVIHKRDYRESSAIVTFLGEQSGIFQAIVRSIKPTKKSNKQAVLQPFQQLEVTTKKQPESGQLANIQQFESTSIRYPFPQESSLFGLYINELTYRLTQQQETSNHLYVAYEQCCYQLLKSLERETQNDLPKVQSYILRSFEAQLLEVIGVNLRFDQDVQGNEILEAENYVFLPAHGFAIVNEFTLRSEIILSGACLQAFQNQQKLPAGCLSAIKKVFQKSFEPFLGNKPLKTVQLWRQLNRFKT